MGENITSRIEQLMTDTLDIMDGKTVEKRESYSRNEELLNEINEKVSEFSNTALKTSDDIILNAVNDK